MSGSSGTLVFMQMGDIKGDSTANGVKEWIRIYSFQWKMARNVRSAIAAGADRDTGAAPMLFPVMIMKDFDIATVYLAQEALTDKTAYKKCVIQFMKTDNSEEMLAKYTFDNCIITDYQILSGAERPREQMTFQYDRFEFEAKQTNPKGMPGTMPRATYDLTKVQGS